jgi:cation diffusion facilitator CzcD-associated flavoprotein CzcO
VIKDAVTEVPEAPTVGPSDADRVFTRAELRGSAPDYDSAAIRAKYLLERDKRLVPGRADTRELDTDVHFADFRKDPFRPVENREPVVDDVDVVIVGGGIAGVLAGANLRKAGVQKIRIVDQAGGIGGTWYWNQYPGVMCDVESYIYMPMLEELDYVPSQRYALGQEIRGHLEAVAKRFDLTNDALFHTSVQRAEWQEEGSRWSVHTDRGDTITCRWYVLAVGILNLMKIPSVPGMETFAGRSFHTARWDYEYTGGSSTEQLDRLSDKTVALIGTGASGIQCLAPLAESAKHVYVFQRTPSAVGVRANRPTDISFADGLKPGWQQDRMDNFQATILGTPIDTDLVDDGWTHHYALVRNPPRPEHMTTAEFLRSAEEVDFRIMEAHRQRVVETVANAATAEILKPQYRYLCKRPCFHDEFLPAFNSPNVTLIDCPTGIERITPNGLVVNGEKFDVDCIIYGTGFEAEFTPLSRRVHHVIVGRDDLDLASKWSEGASTLFGMLIRGFPNMFVMPAPGQQAVITVNYTQLAALGAEFIGRMVSLLERQDAEAFDVSAGAEESWARLIVESFVDASGFMSACTPSRLNFEGHPEQMNPQNGNYGGGVGDWFGYRELLDRWLKAESFEGLELKMRFKAT